ncbi:hypothetical protein LCGC14_1774220 [marine sediment metagenome]|uniref:Uncharacterized protein n=1 Tax=marine sediment metagenome TaxID=412755 RepID=A0A0F9HJV4_9ZZZZ
MEIGDLTKDELLELIARRLGHSIPAHDIKMVRWNTMVRRGKAMAEEACAEMKVNKGPQNWPKYKQAMDKFDKSMELYDKANEFIKSKQIKKENP